MFCREGSRLVEGRCGLNVLLNVLVSISSVCCTVLLFPEDSVGLSAGLVEGNAHRPDGER